MLKDIPLDEKRILVDTINKNGGFRGRRLPYENPFNELELEGILEYGDPRVFDQQEYSLESYFRDENDRVHSSHNTLSFSHVNVQRDLKLATQLGGYAMRNRVQQVTRHRSDSSRRRKIYDILQHLPEKYRPIKDHIIQYDLDKLTNLCAGYKSITVRKVCLVMVQDRAISLGMYPTQDELLQIFGVKRAGLMKIKGALKEASMFGSLDRKIDNMKNSALNLLLELKDTGVINKLQSLKAQSRITELDQFPSLFNGSKHMDFVIAFSALMIDQPQLDLSTLTEKIEGISINESRKCYQAVKRAMGRSAEYVEYINTPSRLVDTPVMGVVVDPIPASIIAEALPTVQPIRESEKVNLPVIEESVEVDQYPTEYPVVNSMKVENEIEEYPDEFIVHWQSSDEITTGTWYSNDTLSMDTMEWYTSKDNPSNDLTEVILENRKSGLSILYRNDYLIQRLLRSGRQQAFTGRPRSLQLIHIPSITVHGKDPPCSRMTYSLLQ
ncbi:MAG: hypothetical protein GPJ54_01660 [Candidatus Heimdallarchaeota archaeon]|nr:hypothetical protein [Candidatus Heimdallarchaeota archaeon]